MRSVTLRSPRCPDGQHDLPLPYLPPGCRVSNRCLAHLPGVRTFCASCGTPLTYTHAERPSEVDVTTCTLDNPEAFPPTYHAWVSHDLAWVRFGDGLTAYHAAKEGEPCRHGLPRNYPGLPA